jgi:hypothetical protein
VREWLTVDAAALSATTGLVTTPLQMVKSSVQIKRLIFLKNTNFFICFFERNSFDFDFDFEKCLV